jgi:putative ABC transport system permease protein
MNLFQLVLKQMRQRALSTWLTLLSVLLGVGLAVTIMILQREGKSLFGQTDYGFDVLVGAKGSPTQLVLNTVYHLDKSPGTVSYGLYERFTNDRNYQSYIRNAVPFSVGDTYQGLPIMGTIPQLFGVDDQGKPLEASRVMEYRPGKRYQVADGRVFAADKFEAVIGSEVAQRTKMKVGDTFHATHGNPGPNETPDVHGEVWTVVGILAPTRTAADRVLYIPLTSFYTIAEHDEALYVMSEVRKGVDANQAVKAYRALIASGAAKPPAPEHDEKPTATGPAAAGHDGHDHDHGGGELMKDAAPAGKDDHDHDEEKHYTVDADGRIHLILPKEVWSLSGIMIKSRSPALVMGFMYNINNGQEAAAVNPASVMRDFFAIFLKPSTVVLQTIVGMVTIVAGIGILVSIYNSVSARLKEIAILRALGATRLRILTLICTEAALIGLVGGLLGLLAGHLLAGVGSVLLDRFIGEGINWVSVSSYEWMYLGAVVVLAALAGLVPALKAYKTPVATNLSAG